MKITIIGVGKLKESYLKNAVNDYIKKIRPKFSIEIIELEDEKTKEKMSETECNLIKDTEGEKILRRIPDNAHIVALAIEGKQMSTKDFKELINKPMLGGKDVVFIIGGSLGLSNQVLKKAHTKISFSRMTFPHQLMRVILLEQIHQSMVLNP